MTRKVFSVGRPEEQKKKKKREREDTEEQGKTQLGYFLPSQSKHGLVTLPVMDDAVQTPFCTVYNVPCNHSERYVIVRLTDRFLIFNAQSTVKNPIRAKHTEKKSSNHR